jgi:hypothetical protein
MESLIIEFKSKYLKWYPNYLALLKTPILFAACYIKPVNAKLKLSLIIFVNVCLKIFNSKWILF